MDACYFGVVVGGCLDPHVLQQQWYYFHWQNGWARLSTATENIG